MPISMPNPIISPSFKPVRQASDAANCRRNGFFRYN
uniref:Uncharacterized protein n=2 Tax=Neisseria meningitidis TaxID=487 RepID=I4E522_NEIME|nr:hypothetical protein predicted by Glimmer/Critica [Neisseria meningitidis alpha153]CCA44438.1 hypothetical protein NMALPHA522_0897 [Neisseria meningitidis alpha522]